MKKILSRFGKPLKIMVLGNGYLGQQIAYLDNMEIDNVGIPSHMNARINTEADAYKVLLSYDEKPDVVINVIGRTGNPNVDWCEKKENRASVYQSNTEVPYILAQVTEKLGIKMVHLSSGCIYDGDYMGRAWRETDAPNFEGSFYSFSKKTAEHLLSPFGHILTLRIRMPFSGDHSPRNLISKLLKYDRIITSPNSITYIPDLIASLEILIEEDQYGIFNVVSPDPITHERILEIFAEEAGDKRILESKVFIRPHELVVKAPRTNTVLDTDKLSQVILLASVEESIREAIKEYLAHDEENLMKRASIDDDD